MLTGEAAPMQTSSEAHCPPASRLRRQLLFQLPQQARGADFATHGGLFGEYGKIAGGHPLQTAHGVGQGDDVLCRAGQALAGFLEQGPALLGVQVIKVDLVAETAQAGGVELVFQIGRGSSLAAGVRKTPAGAMRLKIM